MSIPRFFVAFAILATTTLTAQQAPTFGEQVTVEVVDLEVVVLNREGDAVTDLKSSDFTVLVDGKASEIVGFERHFPEPVQQKAATVAEKTPQPPASPAASQPAPSRVWLVYLDLTLMNNFRRATAIHDLEKFFSQPERRGDRLMIGMFNGRVLTVPQPLTDRLNSISTALRPLARQALPHTSEAPGMELTEEEQEQVKRLPIRALRDFARLASGIEGRKEMLFVGGGFDFGSVESKAYARLMREYQVTRAAIAASDITVHSVLAVNDDSFGAQSNLETSPTEMVASSPDLSAIGPGSLSTVFAADTGGDVLTATPGLAARVERAVEKRNGYYSIAFRSPPERAGRSFKIEIRVPGEEMRVIHRQLVRLRTDPENSMNQTMASLLDRAPRNPAGVSVTVGKLDQDRLRRWHAPLEVRIPAGQTLFVEQEGRRVGHLRFYAGVRDAKGNYASFEANELKLDLSPEEYAALQKNGITYKFEMVVPGGATDLSLTVADVLARTNSTALFGVKTR